MPVFTGVGRL